MEEFSQSRGDDDLFSDEITPLQPLQHNPLAEQVQQPQAQPRDTSNQPEQQSPTSIAAAPGDQGRGRGRGRGRARARGNGPARGLGGLHDSKFAHRPSPMPKPTAEPAKEAHAAREHDTSSSSLQPVDTAEPSKSASDAPTPEAGIEAPPEDAAKEKLPPTGPAQPTNRTPAVRGDRTATGGIPKPKLTKEELDAKLAAAKEKSKALSEKHAKAQADAADFEERERIAKQKRQEELVERRKLEGERERNRARKLQAVGGREWDAEKNEDDFRQPRYGQSIRRGPADHQQDLSIYEWRDEPDGQDGHGHGRGRGRGRGRGGRGRGRGYDQRGGRGNTFNSGASSSLATEKTQPPLIDDFPALPSNKDSTDPATKAPRPPAQQRKDSDMAPTGSWADQMAS